MSHRNRVSILQDEKAMGMDSGDGYTTLGMPLMPLHCTLTMTELVCFMLCTFHQKKRKGERDEFKWVLILLTLIIPLKGHFSLFRDDLYS